jgi:predicted enzyme related to lactoylglutathione lyase
MLKHIYVIDIIVRDLDAAIAYGRKIFGCNPKATSGVGNDIDEFRMAHFAAPGGRSGVHSVGFFELTTDTPQTETGQFMKHYLETHGEGVCLIGFTVDDIDEVQRVMIERGLRFKWGVPQQYQMGRGNELEPSPFGVSFWFAQHNDDGYDQFLALPEIAE